MSRRTHRSTAGRLAAGLLALSALLGAARARAAGQVGVDPAMPAAEQVRALLPAAQRAVEERLGEIDWSGVRVLAQDPNAARRSSVPEWAAGFAIPARALVVLRPDRVGGYPQGSLRQVLTHELAHIGIARRLGPSSLPRWYEEGLAMSIAGEMGAVDAFHVSLGVILGPGAELHRLDEQFRGDRDEAQAAYALSLAFVAWLERSHGPGTARRVLEETARGGDFELALERSTGRSLGALEAAWSREVAIWYRWVPIATSTVTLWFGILLLGFLAWARKRRRVREIRERWEREDLLLDDIDTSGPHGPN